MHDGAAGGSAKLERELKFSLGGDAATLLRAHALLAGIRPTTEALTSVYFDTAQRTLHRAGISLRLRHGPGGTVQTVKRGAGEAGGLFSRQESETSVEGDVPDVAHLVAACGDLDEGAVKDDLVPQFRVDVERTEWAVSFEGSHLLVDLDQGTIKAGSREAPFCELEIELRSGRIGAIFDFARELAAFLPWQVETASKSERGFALLDGTDADAAKATPISLSPGSTAADAFQILAGAAIQHFAANAAWFRTEREAEPIHQMRVAIRRFRSLLAFHRDLFTRAERAGLRDGVRSVFDRLGAARNLDILLAETGRWPARSLPKDALGRLRDERSDAYAEVSAILASPRYRLALLDLIAFVECGAWTRRRTGRTAAARGEPASAGAGRAFRRAWKAITTERRPSRLAAAKRHRLRIHAKRLRYACDFYGGLYANKKTAARCAKMGAATAQLQDALGLLTDRAMIDTLITERLPGVIRPEPALTGEADGETLLARADEAHRRLRRRKPFWV